MRWLHRKIVQLQIAALKRSVPIVEQRLRLAEAQGWRDDASRHNTYLSYYRGRIIDLETILSTM